jgi:CubicO group peptidase (beta-lactamase class C family)
MPARFGVLTALAIVPLFLICPRPLYASDAANDLDNIKGVEAFLDQFFQEKMAERHVPGAVFVLVKDGRMTFAKGFGYADLERKIPVVPDRTVFQVASVSKPFTATAVMQQYERGRLKLDENVNHYLHSFQLRNPFPKPVTLANLLTHTGGFDERTIGTGARTRDAVKPLGQYLAVQMPACSLPPGDVISYSNHGMTLAGYIVEETSGVPFARYVAENILKPLGMRHSSFEPGEELEAALAVGYDYEKDKHSYRAVPRTYRNDSPAGQLVATGTDMAAFMIAHLQGGRYQDTRILEEGTARDMHRQHFTQHPRLPGCAYGFFERFQNGRRSLEHSGDLSGFASLLCLLPAENVGFFVSCNRDDFKLRDDLVMAFLDRYYPASAGTPFPSPPADFARRAALFTGNYRYNRYSRTTLEKPMALVQQVRVVHDRGGTLTIEMPDILREFLATIRLVEVEPLVFRRDDGDRYAAFRMDADGRITHLALNVLGVSVVLEKVPWYETPVVQGGIAIGILSVFVSACVVWPLVALFRWWRSWRSNPVKPRLTPWLAFLVSALNLAFVVGLAAVVYLADLDYGIPPAVPALLSVPLAAAGLTAVLTVCVFLAWKNRSGSAFRRCYLSLVALASVGFLFFLSFWNLLGFRY